MSTTVKSLKVTYNPINEKKTVSNGDWISGQVRLELAKDCQIGSLYIKFKGRADVRWTERHNETTDHYYAREKYFDVKQYFIREEHNKDDKQTLLRDEKGEPYCCVVAPGSHVYPFTFQIPLQDAPSSFSGSVGKIGYSLKVKLKRSMRADQKDSTKINFVSKADLNRDSGLMSPQHESKDKKIFTSGTVAMDVNLEKKGFFQGEGLKVLAHVQNNSSREVKPKYCLYSKHSFFARGKRRVNTKDLLKEVGEPIPPSTNKEVTRVITIPHDMEPSIQNCHIIKVEHRLRVYLDIKYASDPEIKFPIVILPATQVPAVAPPPAASGFGVQPFGNPNPPAWGVVPPPPAAAPNPLDPPPPYGGYEMYPPVTDFGNKY